MLFWKHQLNVTVKSQMSATTRDRMEWG